MNGKEHHTRGKRVELIAKSFWHAGVTKAKGLPSGLSK